MSTKYKFHNPQGMYFITLTVVYWIDVFTRSYYKDLFIESLKYCQEHKGLTVHAYVIMTNHVHLIVSKEGRESFSAILRDLKKYTAVTIINAIKSNPKEGRKSWMLGLFLKAGKQNSNNVKYQFWIQNNHPKELISNQMIDQKLNYIHFNPVVAGLVIEPAAFTYSSAASYEGKAGFLELDFIEL